MSAARGSVLVVDDEPIFGDVVAHHLERAGYAARVVRDGRSALEEVARERPDLVVLDVRLPEVPALDLLRHIRERDGDRTAVILLTAHGDELDRVAGLRLGADECVGKPFAPADLVARVRAILRRASTAPADPLCHGALCIDARAHRVTVEGREVVLTRREFDLLHFLVRHPGEAFTRGQLMERVWGHSRYPDTTTVTVHVRRLRAKVERDPSEPRWIETVWGVGYRFAP